MLLLRTRPFKSDSQLRPLICRLVQRMDVPRQILAGDRSTENRNIVGAEPLVVAESTNALETSKGQSKVSEAESSQGLVPRLDFSRVSDAIASFNLGASIQLPDNHKIDGFDNSSVGSKCIVSTVCCAFACKRCRYAV